MNHGMICDSRSVAISPAVGVGVGDGVLVGGIGVGVGDGVLVGGIGVGVGDGVLVGGTRVAVGMGVLVGDGVLVGGTGVGVAVGNGVLVGGTGVAVAVADGGGVGSGAAVGVGGTRSSSQAIAAAAMPTANRHAQMMDRCLNAALAGFVILYLGRSSSVHCTIRPPIDQTEPRQETEWRGYAGSGKMEVRLYHRTRLDHAEELLDGRPDTGKLRDNEGTRIHAVWVDFEAAAPRAPYGTR